MIQVSIGGIAPGGSHTEPGGPARFGGGGILLNLFEREQAFRLDVRIIVARFADSRHSPRDMTRS